VTEKTKEMLDNPYQNWEELQESLINITASRVTYSGQWTLSNGTLVEFSIVPLPDGASLFTISDETAKAKITAALEDRHSAMKAADKLKTEFIASMSYELRTPLNSIIGFSEILNLENFGELNDRQKDYINAILSSSITLKYLIDDILDLSIIEADKMELDIENIDIKVAIEKAMEMSQETAQNKGVKLSSIDGKIADTSIEGDLRRITQAIHTIITDGISRTETDSSIKVGLKGTKKAISISVAEAKASHNRSNEDQAGLIGLATDPDKNKKLNLSLSLVESFIKIHGGELDISNEAGGGRKVTCTLPRKNIMRRPAGND